MSFTLRSNERVFLCGITGSGKTHLAKMLLAPSTRLIVIDSKMTLKDWNLKEPGGLDWWRFGRGGSGRFRIAPPIVDNPLAWYETLFERLYDYGNLTLYIDEAYGVTSGSKPGKWLQALYTRGRELGIGVWASSQRPSWVPLYLISEADWLAVFRLNLIEDRQRMASIAGVSVVERVSDKHGFWLYHSGDELATYYGTAVLKQRTGV